MLQAASQVVLIARLAAEWRRGCRAPPVVECPALGPRAMLICCTCLPVLYLAAAPLAARKPCRITAHIDAVDHFVTSLHALAYPSLPALLRTCAH